MTGRWHILDAGLRASGGHHVNQALALARELSRRGIDATFYANVAVESALLPGIDVKPVFRAFLYDTMSPDASCGELEDFLALNRWCFDDLSRHGAEHFAKNDTILVPSATFNQLWGIVQWAGALPPANRPKIVAILMFPPDWAPYTRAVSQPWLYYRFILRNCPAPVRVDLRLGTETEALAQRYSAVLGTAPAVMPALIAGWDTASAARGNLLVRRAPDTALVAYLGHSRQEKGFRLLPDTVRRVAASVPEARFFIQSYHSGEAELRSAEEQLAACDTVHLHRGTMDRSDYLSVLLAADLVLLPYDPARYEARGSGIYQEAAMAGRPVAVVEGSWMARDIAEQGNGVVIAAFTPDAASAAVRKALADIDELGARARRHRDRILDKHGASAYVDGIIDLMRH